MYISTIARHLHYYGRGCWLNDEPNKAEGSPGTRAYSTRSRSLRSVLRTIYAAVIAGLFSTYGGPSSPWIGLV